MWLLCLALALAFEVPQLMTFEERLQFLSFNPELYKGSFPVHDKNLGFSIALSKDVKKGDCIVAISQKECITSADKYALSPFLESFSEQEQLSFRAMYERLMPRDSNDIRREYVHSLPAQIELPLFWAEEDFQLFESLTLEFYSRDALRVYNFEKLHARLVEALEDVPNLPTGMLELDMLKWGVAISMSRSFHNGGDLMKEAFGNKDEKRNYQMLLPLADIINHAPIPLKERATRVTIFQVFRHLEMWTCYKAQYDQKAGQHVLGNYGDFHNFRLLIDYGFSFERNPDDSLSIVLQKTDYCTGQVQGEQCRYSTSAHLLSAPALKHLFREKADLQIRGDPNIDALFKQVQIATGSKRAKLVSALLTYRTNVFEQFVKVPLRTLYRERTNCPAYRCYSIYTFAIGQRVNRLLHVRQMERRLLGLLADIL